MGIKYFENVKSFYLIGIGGISMSAIASFLISRGYKVRGSDICESEITEKLRREGAEVFVPHDRLNISDEKIVIYNSAIRGDNCELSFARDSDKLVLSRAEFLNLMGANFSHSVYVAGSHGKTTATCMIAHIFDAAGKKFCAHIGGEDLDFSNFVYKGDDYFISEACEYKKNILKLKGETALLLNADCDHMECYSCKEELDRTFRTFLGEADNAVVCGEGGLKILPNDVTFSLRRGCYYPENICSDGEKYSFDIIERDEFLCGVKLNVYGKHNIYNALAAAAVARLYGISGENIKRGLSSFKGVKRRFEFVGSFNGARVICDYAHHPDEISAVINTAKKITGGELYVIFQPHTYSRTKFLMERFVNSFKDIKNIAIYKTYPAREKYDEEGSAKTLADRIKNARYEDCIAGLKDFLSNVKKEDLILVLGAGDIYSLVKIMPEIKD